MRDSVIRSVVLSTYERLSGRRSWSACRRLEAMQWLAGEELAARAAQKLAPLVRHAAAHVPYYRDLFRAHGVDAAAIRSIDDLARVPLTTKAALRRAFPAGTVADNVPRRRLIGGATSGSTGTPFRFYRDRAGEDSRHASYLFFLHWTGAAIGDTRVVIAHEAGMPRDPALVTAARRLLLGDRAIRLSGVDLTLPALCAHLQRVRSRYVIQAYPSYAARLAGAILERGIDLGRYPVAVITMAETLTPLDADVIARAFRCRVFNHYSTWEVLHIAQTCPDDGTLLHVNTTRAVVRVVREDGGAAAPGERGRVVLSDLDNYAMPFINYDVGDWAVAGGPCSCGRGFMTIRDLEGRVTEVIRTPDGRVVAPAALTRTLTRLVVDRIWEFQAVHTALDAVTLTVVPSPRFTRELEFELRRHVEALLGPAITLTIETADRIAPEPSGKRLIIKPLPEAGPVTP